MGRVSQADAQANRKQVVRAALRLFREKGIPNVSVAEIMHSAGLTHGGFYKQFESKDALVGEAAALGFADMMDELAALDSGSGGHSKAWPALLDAYLSADHRDDPGDGCPAAGFAGDLAHEPAHEHAATYAAGVREMAGWIAPGEAGLSALAAIVGGILLARATTGTDLSEEILRAVRHAYDSQPR
jgi:TetR/AcrR family transcriptional regulator, transcriptional repressor for nem operon